MQRTPCQRESKKNVKPSALAAARACGCTRHCGYGRQLRENPPTLHYHSQAGAANILHHRNSSNPALRCASSHKQLPTPNEHTGILICAQPSQAKPDSPGPRHMRINLSNHNSQRTDTHQSTGSPPGRHSSTCCGCKTVQVQQPVGPGCPHTPPGVLQCPSPAAKHPPTCAQPLSTAPLQPMRPRRVESSTP